MQKREIGMWWGGLGGNVKLYKDIQGFPQIMRVQRRPYGIYVVCFHTFILQL